MKGKTKKKEVGNSRRPLRIRAEETLLTGSPKNTVKDPALRRLIHELEIHQVELKLQNEELRRAQVELAASRDRYTHLFEFAPLAYITLDTAGRILEGNHMTARLLRVEHRDLARTHFSKFIASESQDDWYLHRRAVLSKETKRVCEINIRRTDGTVLTVRAESIAIGRGNERHCRTALFDITERKRVEQEREQLLAREQAARQEVEAATKAKDRFLAMVSHELRTPLTPIVAWSGLLRGKAVNESKVDLALECIERNARMEAKLVDDLLEVSRSLTGKMSLNLKRVELPEIIKAAVDTVRPSADAKQIEIHIELDKDTTLTKADPERLQQVICNLLTNAVKFTQNGGRIDAQLFRSADSVEIVVSDNGEGIPADFLPHIFDPFSQAKESMTRRENGLGLGLAIVRNIVEMHGGTIQVKSKVGKGTAFTIRIPAMNDHASKNNSRDFSARRTSRSRVPPSSRRGGDR